MSNLSNQFISNSYQSVLNVGTGSGSYVTSTLQPITDGFGSQTPLRLSTTKMAVSGNLQITGSIESSLIPATSGTLDLGSPTRPWRHIYASSGSIYLDDHQILSLDAVSAGNTDIAAPPSGTVNLINDVVFASREGLGYEGAAGFTIVGGGTAFESQTRFSGDTISYHTGSIYKTNYWVNDVNVQTGDTSFELELFKDNFKLATIENSRHIRTIKDSEFTVYGQYRGTGSYNSNIRHEHQNFINNRYATAVVSDASVYLGVGALSSSNPTTEFRVISGSIRGAVEDQPLTSSFELIDNKFVVTGSIVASDGFTGNVTGTASFATNALSASRAINANSAITASQALNSNNADLAINANNADLLSGTGSAQFANTGSNTFNGTQTISGSLNVTGTITATSASITYLETIYQTSSVVYSSGSNILGDASNDTQTLNGRVDIPLGNLNVTGSTTSSLGFFGNLQGTASFASNALSASWAPMPDVSGFATTGSNSFNGNQTITGSLVASGSQHIIRGNVDLTGSMNIRNGNFEIISDNTTLNPDLYLTSSQAGQTNIIKGWGDSPLGGGAGAVQANYTGSLAITGSNNIVSLPQIRATNFGLGADLQGYISGSDNTLNGNSAGIFLNTGSLLFPKTLGNSLGPSSAIAMNFTTSSLAGGHPNITNNTLYAGGFTINSNSGSIGANANLFNNGSIVSNQNFVTNTRVAINGNTVVGAATLNHVSSSILFNSNLVNAAPVTVNNAVSSSGIANNTLTVANNAFIGGVTSIFASGSQSSNVSRNITSNLIGGVSNVISSSFVSSSNSNLTSTIVYGNSLTVSASHNAGTNGGSAFFGRFNDTGSLHLAQDIVFAVGTGTAAGSRRTGLYVTSGSLVGVSGSLALTGSLGVSGSSNFIGGTIRVSGSEFRTNNYVIYDGSPNDPGAMTNFVGSFLTSRNTFTFNNIVQAQLSTGSNFSITTDTGSTFTNINFQSQYGGTNTLLSVGNYNGSRNVDVKTDTMTITGSVSISNLPTSTGSFFVTTDSTGQLTKATPDQALPALFDVGYFYSTQTQSGSANTSGSFTFDNTVPINEITVSGSRINIPKTAWYNFQFSIQADQGSGAADVAVWLKKDGVNVANSATYVTVPSNHKQLISLNLWEQVNSGSYVELAYQSDSANTAYEYITPTGNIPGSPSIIMNVNQIR